MKKIYGAFARSFCETIIIRIADAKSFAGTQQQLRDKKISAQNF